MPLAYDLMYDGIRADVPKIPTTAKKVAGYVSGAEHSFWWQAPDWARFPHAAHLRIDTDGSKPLASDVADCENGDMSPAGAARWARTRNEHGYWADIYCSESVADEVRAACKADGVTRRRFWLAHWGISQAQAVAKLQGDVVAVQFTSPSTHPGQGYDLSVARTDWFPAPTPVKPPPPVHAPMQGLLVPAIDHAGPWQARHVVSHDGGLSWT